MLGLAGDEAYRRLSAVPILRVEVDFGAGPQVAGILMIRIAAPPPPEP